MAFLDIFFMLEGSIVDCINYIRFKVVQFAGKWSQLTKDYVYCEIAQNGFM